MRLLRWIALVLAVFVGAGAVVFLAAVLHDPDERGGAFVTIRNSTGRPVLVLELSASGVSAAPEHSRGFSSPLESGTGGVASAILRLPAGQHEMRVLIGFDDGAAPIRTSSSITIEARIACRPPIEVLPDRIEPGGCVPWTTMSLGRPNL